MQNFFDLDSVVWRITMPLGQVKGRRLQLLFIRNAFRDELEGNIELRFE